MFCYIWCESCGILFIYFFSLIWVDRGISCLVRSDTPSQSVAPRQIWPFNSQTHPAVAPDPCNLNTLTAYARATPINGLCTLLCTLLCTTAWLIAAFIVVHCYTSSKLTACSPVMVCCGVVILASTFAQQISDWLCSLWPDFGALVDLIIMPESLLGILYIAIIIWS